MITQFSKGFYGKPRDHAAFVKAVHEGDCSEIAATAAHSGSKRKFTDAFVMATPDAMQPDFRVQRIKPAETPQPDSIEFLDELEQVYSLCNQLDQNLDDLDGRFPRGITEVSPVLLEPEFYIRPYEKGVDYGVSEKDWQAIQSGADLKFDQGEGKRKRQIKTVRDAATFVHNDDPLAPWEHLLQIILMEQVEKVLPKEFDNEYYDVHDWFVLFGTPFYKGVLGEALRMLGHPSFYWKWMSMYPRPEEVGHHYGKEHLPLAFAEGSPMHPSRGAMHSMAAKVLGWILKLMFKAETMLKFTGESITSTVNHLQDNIGMFRLCGGVHYMSDHTCVDPIAEAVARSVVAKYIGRR